MEETRIIVNKIIDKFEELLKKHNIKIPNQERENNEDEACIYGSDYYDLEDEIIEILDNYIINNNLKVKLKLWIKEVKEEKDVNKAINRFNKLFAKEYEPICFKETSEFFESYTEKYELNDKVTIEKSYWSKFESKVSYTGTDIYIYFQKSKKEENRNGVGIFLVDEYQDNIEKVEKMIEEEMADEVII